MDEHLNKFLNKTFMLASVLIMGILIFFVEQTIFQQKTLEQQNNYQVTVTGEGKIYAKPDVAIINLGVSSQRTTVAEVTKSNTDKMNAVIDAIKALKVEDKDIQTTNYNLTPQYSYTKDGVSVFQGYTLDQTVQVKVRDFTVVGDVLTKATLAEANTIGNLQFTIDDPEQFRQEARAKAIEQAKANAENLAKESGVQLGKIINVYENYNPYPITYSKAVGMGGGVATDMAIPAPTVQPGQQEITININLTYQVK